MPKIDRRKVPPGILRHLVDRVHEREIAPVGLEELARWLDGEPEVPEGPWYRRFSKMIVCGEGEWIRTFLAKGQLPRGKRVD
jgi:hypothetical protein